MRLHQAGASRRSTCAVGLPESPGVQYLLELASLKVGDKDGARRALRLAAGSRADFRERDEARRLLAELR